MHPPLFTGQLTPCEREQLQAGLRSADAFTLRRCQILLASASGQRPRAIAANLGCSAGTARNAIAAFRAEGLACLAEKSSRPRASKPLLDPGHHEELYLLLHQSPRLAGKPRSTWTLALLAEVCCERGWTPRPLSIEAVRHAVARLGVSWRRAKHWITSPDPAYARKKTRATA
jgi:transposase